MYQVIIYWAWSSPWPFGSNFCTVMWCLQVVTKKQSNRFKWPLQVRLCVCYVSVFKLVLSQKIRHRSLLVGVSVCSPIAQFLNTCTLYISFQVGQQLLTPLVSQVLNSHSSLITSFMFCQPAWLTFSKGSSVVILCKLLYWPLNCYEVEIS